MLFNYILLLLTKLTLIVLMIFAIINLWNTNNALAVWMVIVWVASEIFSIYNNILQKQQGGKL